MNLSFNPSQAENPLWAGLEAYCMRKSDAYDAVRFMTTTDFVTAASKLFADPGDYVASMRVYPYDVVQDTTTVPKTTMKAAGVTFKKVGSSIPDDNIMVYSLSPGSTDGFYNVVLDGGTLPLVRPPYEDTSFTGRDYRNFAPYVTVKMWVPFVGLVDVDPALIWYKQPHLRYQVDYTTGDSVWVIYTGSESDATIVTTGSVKLGVNIPIGANNAGQAGVNTVLSSISAVMSTAAGYVSGGAFGAVAGAVGGAINTVNAARVTGSHGTCSGGIGDLYSDRVFTCIIESRDTRYPDDVEHMYGRSSNQTYTLSDLTGYTSVSEVHPEGIPCTAAELEQIVNALRDGIII